MNLVTKNIIANYLGKLWGFVSIFIFVRFYIDFLGIEAYAIINFYTVILGLLVFADGGLTATLTRELARDIPISQKANLVHTFERLYVVVCLLIVVVIYFSADLIANNFLESKTYSTTQVAHYISLIGIGVGLQLFSTLYDGGLQGLQQQVISNKIRITWSFFKSGLVLVPLYFAPKLEIFFWWQILCNFAVLIVYRKKLLSFISYANPLFSTTLLKSVSSYALGMMGIAFISAINIQIDKLVVSKYLTMELFGYYSVASTLAQLPTIIISPIIAAVFPVFSNFVSLSDISAIKNNYHKYSFLITLIVTPVVLCIALYCVPLISLWTGKPEVAVAVVNVVRLLLLGAFFLCLQMTPFYLALANGLTKINFYSGLVGLLITIPMMIFSISQYGMVGATFPWIFINVASFFIVGFYIVKKFLPHEVNKWVIWDILLPVIVSCIVAFAVHNLLSFLRADYFFIIKSGFIGISSVLVNLMLYQRKFPDNKIIDFNSLKNIIGRLK
jgi:O-antigen/teichoic acid export membrane protein